MFARLAQTEEWKAEIENRLWSENYMNSRDSRRYLEAQYSAQKTVLNELGLAKQ